MLFDVRLVLDQLFSKLYFHFGCVRAELGHAIDHDVHEVKAVELIHHEEVERRGDRAFLLVAAHMEIAVIGAVIVRRVRRTGDAISTTTGCIIQIASALQVFI